MLEQGFDLLVDMLAAEPMIVLNAAFCQLHRKRCPPSEQLLRECSYVRGPLTCPCCIFGLLVACLARLTGLGLADNSHMHYYKFSRSSCVERFLHSRLLIG
jgi:hypothetical protein